MHAVIFWLLAPTAFLIVGILAVFGGLLLGEYVVLAGR
jgi:hypothetical protein